MTELHGGDGPPIPPVPPDAGKAVYPLGLDLAGRRVVVVGGGRVALRRTRALVEAGALVTVIAPRFTTDFLEQETSLATRPAAGSGLTLVRRGYADGDLAGAWLVHAATDDPAVNAAVAAAADRDRIWCVRADDAAASAAWTPAVTRHGDVRADSPRDRKRRRVVRGRFQDEPGARGRPKHGEVGQSVTVIVAWNRLVAADAPREAHECREVRG